MAYIVMALALPSRGIEAGVPDPILHHPFTTSTTTVGRTAQIARNLVRHFQRLTGLFATVALDQWASSLSFTDRTRVQYCLQSCQKFAGGLFTFAIAN